MHQPSIQPIQKTLLSVRDVANALDVNETTVRRWIKAGLLEAFSLPHEHKRQIYRIRRETLKSFGL